MPTITKSAFFLPVVSAFTTLLQAQAPGQGIIRRPNAVKNEYIVGLTDRNPAAAHGLANSLAAAYGGEIRFVFDRALGGFSVIMPEANAERIAMDPRVRFVEENYAVTIDPVENISAVQDTHFASPSGSRYLWYLDRIDQRYPDTSGQLDGQFTYCSSGDGVVVYVLDVGIWKDHEQFQRSGGSVVVEGHDFYRIASPGDSLNPCPGESTSINAAHGTAVASLIAGKDLGVAKDVEIVSLTVGNCNNGNMLVDRIIGALNWIIGGTELVPSHFPSNSRHPGKRGIVNLSGFTAPRAYHQDTEGRSSSIEVAIRDVVYQNIVVVTSANNFNWNAAAYAPSNLGYRGPGATGLKTDGSTTHVPPVAITVGGSAFDPAQANIVNGVQVKGVDRRWDDFPGSAAAGSGSNSGSSVSIWAPAADILAARSQGFSSKYGIASGTSFAAPLVAGVAARVLERLPSVSPQQVYNEIDYWATKYESGSTVPRVRNTATLGYDTPIHPQRGPVGLLYFREAQPCKVHGATLEP